VIETAVMVAMVDGRIVEGVPSVDGLKTADLVEAMGRLHRHSSHILDMEIPRGDQTRATATTRGSRGKMTDACTDLDQVQITQLPESGEGSTTWKES